MENYDRASFHPCAVRAENDTVFFVTDPVSGCIYMLELLNQGLNALIQRIIKNELILKSTDCILFKQQFLIVTYPVQENPEVASISYETEDVTFVLEDLVCSFGLCEFGNHVLFSDQEKHAVY